MWDYLIINFYNRESNIIVSQTIIKFLIQFFCCILLYFILYFYSILKRLAYCFFPLYFQKIEISPKTFKLLVFTLLQQCFKISRHYLVPVSNYWTWTKITLQKHWFFWSNPDKIKVQITSFIETLELPKFGYMNTFIMQVESRDKILMAMSWTEIMVS